MNRAADEARGWAAELLAVPDDASPRAVIAAAERLRRHLARVVTASGRRRDLTEAVETARDILLGLAPEAAPADVVINVPGAVTARLASVTSGWRHLWHRYRGAVLTVAWAYAVLMTASAVLVPRALVAVLIVQGVLTAALVVSWRASGAPSPLVRATRVVTGLVASVVGLVVASAAMWLMGIVAPLVAARTWLRSRWVERPRRRRWTPVERWVLGGPLAGEVWELRPGSAGAVGVWDEDGPALALALGDDLFLPLLPDQGQVAVTVADRRWHVDLRLAQGAWVLGCLARRVGRLDDGDLELLAGEAGSGVGAVVDLRDRRSGGGRGEPPDGDLRRWSRGA